MKRFSSLLILLAFITPTSAQEIKSFSLAQAQAYAMEHNYVKLNADKDLLIAKKKVKETTGIGLPQVNAEVSFQNFIDVPTNLAPASAFGPGGSPDELIELQFGTDYNTTAGLSASQIIFNGPYLVGLRASKVYKNFFEKNVDKTILEMKEDVAQAYYLVLVAEENKRILSKVAGTTENLLEETTKIYQAGLLEELNVDQLKFTLNDIKNSLESADAQIETSRNFLKFQIGYDIKHKIELTDNIEALSVVDNNEKVLTTKLDISGHIDFQLIKVQEELTLLDFKKEKLGFAPSLNGFFTYQKQNMSNNYDAFSGGKWYPTTFWGLSLQLPLVAGGTRLAKTAQAKIANEKAQTTTKQVEQSLIMQAQKSRSAYNTALNIYHNQKEGVALAEKIHTQSTKKYKEGMISSMDLSQAQNQYLNAEGKYIKALLDLFNARSNLNKALGIK